MVTQTKGRIVLDDVDRGILHVLQRHARNATHDELSERVNVSASTVRNRIAQLEDAGVIEAYTIRINYERAGFPLHIQFICTAPVDDRNRKAREILEIDGVVNVREMLTSERNLIVEVIATGTGNLVAITKALNDRCLTVHSSEIITNTYDQPFTYFDADTPVERPEETPEGVEVEPDETAPIEPDDE